jgi:hypothetical protein
MTYAPRRETVTLDAFPDLIVMSLGMKVGSIRCIPQLLSIGKSLAEIKRTPPDGLLAHESMRFGWNHFGFRQYWRDLEALERFTRSMPHSRWWGEFLKDPKESGFWHETYCASGGMEAVYVNMPERIGLASFAPVEEAAGHKSTSRGRLSRSTKSPG